MRAEFDAKKWPDQWFEKNAIQLATIRNELRERAKEAGRDVAMPFHPAFDEPLPQEQQAPQTYEREPGMEG